MVVVVDVLAESPIGGAEVRAAEITAEVAAEGLAAELDDVFARTVTGAANIDGTEIMTCFEEAVLVR